MPKRISQATIDSLDPQRICLIKPSAFGDVIQTLPVLTALRDRFPQAEISWVINSGLSPLIDGHPHLTDWIPFHRRGGLSGWVTLLRTLRRRRFDLVLDLQGLLRTAVMCVASRAPLRLGLETAREQSHLSCHGLIPDTSKQVPAHQRYWRVAEFLGFEGSKPSAIVPVSDADSEWARTKLDDLPRPIMGIHAGARWVTKRWPWEKYAEVATRGLNDWVGSAVLLGSPDESDVSQRIARRLAPDFGGRVLDLTGQTTLKQLAAVTAEIDFVVSNDSGPMHLADALGTPLVGVFTCTDPLRSGPPPGIHQLVSTNVECRAGYHKKCPMAGERHLACFGELDVDRVVAALDRLHEQSQNRAA